MHSPTDTIAAISTPPGKGGVAVIRISGEGATAVAAKVFRTPNGAPVSTFTPRHAAYGRIISEGEVIDDVVLTYFKAPASYTGEDTVEISCHGGILVTREVLRAVLSAGARAAEAGEFTRRAFICGRLSLSEAEAIGTLLSAESEEQLRLAQEPSRRRLTDKIADIRGKLTGIMSSLFARIDYPDEDLGDYSDEELLTSLYNIKEDTERLVATYKTGKAITEGVRTVIFGKPNVGKSSLYNLLVGEDAAIVTDIAGTTRDVLSASLPLGRVVLRLHDTAGVRSSCDSEVEKIGIERATSLARTAELVIAVFDLSTPPDESDREIIELLESLTAAKLAIFNKSDLAPSKEWGKLRTRVAALSDSVLEISAKRNTGAVVESLSREVDRLFTDKEIRTGADAIVHTARVHASLLRALDFLTAATAALAVGHSQDTVASDIERALAALSDSDAREVAEEVVADIFSRFCVGK